MPRWRKALFALVALFLVFAAAEGLLRLVGFRYQRITTYMQFNYPRPGFLKGFFSLDPELLYRIRPTVKQRGVDLIYAREIDLKFRGTRPFGPKPAGGLRVVALGDSSTYGVNTREPWPQRLERRLQEHTTTEVLNLGVPGYTAFQGRKLLESRGRSLDADLFILYFGWNDHLLALGFSDHEQRLGSRTTVAVRNLIGGARVYQFVSWVVAGLRGPPAGAPAGDETRRRVGPSDFDAELRRMVSAARALGAGVILCTYPTALPVMQERRLPPPDWLVETHMGQGDLQGVRALHDSYNDIVRQVARDTGATLADLDAAFTHRGRAGLFADPAGGDFIHPDEAGYRLVADQLALSIRAAAAKRLIPARP